MTRLPDFIIVGAMKSGTTSLHRWLGAQPEVWLPERKEPDFFSTSWSRGPAWYAELFAPAGDGCVAGEASVSYTSPSWAPVVARRLAQTLPSVRLVYLVRDPIERLRSHYRHEVQRGRERRPFVDAVCRQGNPYVAYSSYATCLEPYLELFPRSQLCVARFEDLVFEPYVAWSSVCRHLGIAVRPPPGAAHNVTAAKPQFGRVLGRAWRSDLFGLVRYAPASLRRLGKRALTIDDAAYRTQLDGSYAPLPDEVTEPIWQEAARLGSLLGTANPLWELARGPGTGGART